MQKKVLPIYFCLMFLISANADNPKWLSGYLLEYQQGIQEFVPLKDGQLMSLKLTNGTSVLGKISDIRSASVSIEQSNGRKHYEIDQLSIESRSNVFREDFAHFKALSILGKTGAINKEQSSNIMLAHVRAMKGTKSLSGKINQVVKNGLLFCQWEGNYKGTDINKWGEPVFIECDPSGYTETNGELNQIPFNNLFRIGEFQYQTAIGVMKTIERYTQEYQRALCFYYEKH